MGQQQVVMELKWQQAFLSERPLPEQETVRATGDGWTPSSREPQTHTHG